MKISPIQKGDEYKLLKLAKEGEPGISANNRMIYFLATSVLSRYVFIGEIKGEPVAYIFAIKDSTKPSIWLHQIVVAKNYRGKGYGRKLLQFLKEKAQKDDIHNIELMVKPDNPAKNLYAENGYNEIELNKELNMVFYRMVIAS